MTDNFIYLLEKYLDTSANPEERIEFENLINSNPELYKEYKEQKRIKEVLKQMKLKNPSVEVWDSYWLGIYNRIERGLAWIMVSIGVLIILGFAALEFVNFIINDNTTPVLLKTGIIILVFGIFVLLFSVGREKFFTRKHDKYKEIQR
ncbi:MAG: hypothetical protein CVV23_04260 [Ignavibacteriae bacterium HGW-Ignavibacteriae-2]|jgi:uncharacterized membrane protein|nr:MAG: hypothetical protein CVV23_04260 [Ignavibacteriae bacterium HGW-Ignavibacteriae-2]